MKQLLLVVLVLVVLVSGCIGSTGTPPAGGVTVMQDQAYGPGASRDNLFDAYLPDPSRFPGERPAIILVHGGGFQTGSKSGFRAMATRFAQEGFVSVAPNYELSQGQLSRDEWQPWLDACQRAADDVRLLLEYLEENHGTYSIDAGELYLAGASAGGTAILHAVLADCGTQQPLEEDYSNVKAVFSLWGGLMGPDSPLHGDQGLNYFTPSDPAVAVIHGTEDSHFIAKYEAGLEIIRQANESEVYNEFYPLEGSGHGPWDRSDEITASMLEFILLVRSGGAE